MGYARYDLSLTEFPKSTNQRGYSHKLCPWSTAYRDKFRYEGNRIVGYNGAQPIYQFGVWVIGNSVDPSFTTEYATYECSDHTFTEGRMEPNQNPPGWICKDPNCCYYTTVASGKRYKEI